MGEKEEINLVQMSFWVMTNCAEGVEGQTLFYLNMLH